MKLLLLCFLVATILASHMQSPAFNNWLNSSQVALRPQNPAFNNWLNSSQAGPRPQNPAFNNWLNGSQSAVRPGFPNPNSNIQNLDMRFGAFLRQNRINANIPPTMQCLRHSTPILHNNYRVTCALPNGQRFTETCYGRQNCNIVTCKLQMCSRMPRGGLFRVGF